MGTILAMMVKDLKLLARDRMGSIFTFIFPLVMAIFFGTIFSGTGPASRALTLALVDEDGTPESRAFADTLGASPEFQIEPMTREAAREAVRLGRRTAYVALPPGFGEARRRMFYGEPPEIEVGLDPSREAEGGMIQGLLTRHLSQQMQELFGRGDRMEAWIEETRASLDTARGLPAERRATIQRFFGELGRFQASIRDSGAGADSGRAGGGWQPARFRTADIARVRRGPRNAYDVSFPQGVMWAVLSTAYGFALSLVMERTRGTLVRLRMAPISRGQILLGKAGGCLFTIVTVSTVLLLIGALVFNVRPNSWGLLAAAVLSSAIGFVGIMMLISVMGRSQRGVSGLGWAAMMAMSMTGGAMVPLFVMPPWMQTASQISPVRWGIIAIEGAIWRDFTVQQMLLPCAILVAIGVVGFAVGVRVFRWTESEA